jgi:3-hydroxyisobutyrate dehydrogenase-like beta-hydroxyacid dehydrogenase
MDDDKARLAVIGLGAMGSGMAHRLVEAEFAVTVYNRTAAKAEPLVAAGAKAAASAAEAVAEADIVLLSLADEDAVESVLFGTLASVLTPEHLVVDTSTVSPAFSRDATDRLARQGLRRLEACVIGNPQQARGAGLRVLAGGPADDVALARPMLDVIGSQVLHLGPVGAATAMKLVFNLMLGAQIASMAEAVAYGVAAGLDRDLLLVAIENSGFSSRVMAFRAALARERRYEPAAFRTRLMAKDLRLGLGEAAAAGVAMPVIEASAESFVSVVEAGLGEVDAAVIVDQLLDGTRRTQAD